MKQERILDEWKSAGDMISFHINQLMGKGVTRLCRGVAQGRHASSSEVWLEAVKGALS